MHVSSSFIALRFFKNLCACSNNPPRFSILRVTFPICYTQSFYAFFHLVLSTPLQSASWSIIIWVPANCSLYSFCVTSSHSVSIPFDILAFYTVDNPLHPSLLSQFFVTPYSPIVSLTKIDPHIFFNTLFSNLINLCAIHFLSGQVSQSYVNVSFTGAE